MKIIPVALVFLIPVSTVIAKDAQDETGIFGPGAQISITSPLEVGKSVISLGDIATFRGMSEDVIESLSAIEVGKAPPPGQTRTLSLAIVKIRLRQKGYDPDSITISGPVTIVVSTRPAVMNYDEIIRAVEDYVKANMPWDPTDVRISVAPGQDRILVPDGDIQVQVEPSSTTKFLGTTNVKAQIVVNGKVSRILHVRVRLDVTKEVVVATRTIRRNEIISPDDLTLRVHDLANVPPDVVFDPLLVDGMMAKHTIQAGKPVTFSSIQCLPVISRGDLVTLEAMSGGVIVAIPGEALESGSVGDRIRVRNTSSGAVVSAKVIDSQRVQGI